MILEYSYSVHCSIHPHPAHPHLEMPYLCFNLAPGTVIPLLAPSTSQQAWYIDGGL